MLGKKQKKDISSILSFPLTRKKLVQLKQKARRRGCWYRNLKQNERMLLDLTIRVVEKVRSFMLARVISKIVSKLQQVLESPIVRLIRTEGQRMAKNISDIAKRLGYKDAKDWSFDRGFMQYLTINNLESLKSN